MEPTMKDEFVVDLGSNEYRFPNQSAAQAQLATCVAELANTDGVDGDGDFSGRLSWYVEPVPATPFDELIQEYMHNPHGGSADEWSVDRDAPFLLVEENTSGGYWLTSGATVEDLVTYHVNQEYASEWYVLGVYDAATGDNIDYSVTTAVTVK